MHIDKDKIPKGTSFVLKSSTFDEALQSASITTDTHLKHTNNSRILFAASFSPNPDVDYERFYVSAGIVPSTVATAARQFVASQVIPQFIAWASGILAEPPNSPIRRAHQRFSPDVSAYASIDPLRRTAVSPQP
jgi:hypothetical protein